MERIYLAQDRAGTFEHGNEILNSISGEEYLGYTQILVSLDLFNSVQVLLTKLDIKIHKSKKKKCRR